MTNLGDATPGRVDRSKAAQARRAKLALFLSATIGLTALVSLPFTRFGSVVPELIRRVFEEAGPYVHGAFGGVAAIDPPAPPPQTGASGGPTAPSEGSSGSTGPTSSGSGGHHPTVPGRPDRPPAEGHDPRPPHEGQDRPPLRQVLTADLGDLREHLAPQADGLMPSQQAVRNMLWRRVRAILIEAGWPELGTSWADAAEKVHHQLVGALDGHPDPATSHPGPDQPATVSDPPSSGAGSGSGTGSGNGGDPNDGQGDGNGHGEGHHGHGYADGNGGGNGNGNNGNGGERRRERQRPEQREQREQRQREWQRQRESRGRQEWAGRRRRPRPGGPSERPAPYASPRESPRRSPPATRLARLIPSGSRLPRGSPMARLSTPNVVRHGGQT